MKNWTRREMIRTAAAGSAALSVAGLGGSCSKPPVPPQPAPASTSNDLKNIRLLDYHPRPMLTVKQTAVEKARFPVIDTHNHLKRIVDADTTLSDMLKIMDDCNVAIVVDLDGYPGGVFERSLKKFKASNPDRFIVYTRLDWKNVNDSDFGKQMAEKIERDVEKGAQALKIRKELALQIKLADGTYLPVDSPKLDPVWDKCGSLGIPVTIHVGDPLAFFTPLDKDNERLEEVIDHPDWMFNRPELYKVEDILEQRSRMIAKHPKTKFIAAHVGGQILRSASRSPQLIESVRRLERPIGPAVSFAFAAAG